MSSELESKAKALENMSNDHSRLRDRTSKLHKEVRRLRKKTLRLVEQRTHAVEAALAKAADEFKMDSHTWRIKRPDGRIEDWVRDLTCKLIAVHHVPASRTPGVISDVFQALKTHVSGPDGMDIDGVDPRLEKFSDRSARRFPIEHHVKGKIRVAKEFKAASG